MLLTRETTTTGSKQQTVSDDGTRTDYTLHQHTSTRITVETSARWSHRKSPRVVSTAADSNRESAATGQPALLGVRSWNPAAASPSPQFLPCTHLRTCRFRSAGSARSPPAGSAATGPRWSSSCPLATAAPIARVGRSRTTKEKKVCEEKHTRRQKIPARLHCGSNMAAAAQGACALDRADTSTAPLCVCACVRVCVRVRECVCVRARVRVCGVKLQLT